MGERTLIMGVLNVTPDSFSDGGLYSDPDRAYARALEMEEQGADIIDLGAESTRPDSKRVSAEEEWRRLLPVLKLLRGKLTVPLSLDTYKSEIAERALQFGVSIFNDPSGLTFDANLAKVAAENNAGLILNHMRGTPETWGKQPALSDVMGAVQKDLEATVSRARRAGVEKIRIVVDPGLGFGKRREQNSEILAHLERLAELDYPILVGPSRKSFLSHAAEGETAFATAAAVAVAVLNGAHIVRVHDVKEMRSAAQIADEVVRTAAAWQSAQEAASERVAPRPKARFDGGSAREERSGPPRPPLLQRPTPVDTPVVIPAPVAAPEPVRPVEIIGDRPVFRRPAADRPPKRDSGDRPERREYQDRPAAGRPAGPRRDQPGSDRDRPVRPAGDRPSRPFGDRPARPAGDRPSRPFGDRPPRPAGDRPSRPFGDRPPRPAGDRPSRPFGDRPPRPAGDRPPHPFGDRPPRNDRVKREGPRGDERPRSFRPGVDRPRGDKPTGFKGPGFKGPDKGAPPSGARPSRPAGDRPPRPFRKRP